MVLYYGVYLPLLFFNVYRIFLEHQKETTRRRRTPIPNEEKKTPPAF